MAVDDSGVIDILSFTKTKDTVNLTISDHLDWSQCVDHQEILQRKLNDYLSFVECGQLVDEYPEAEGLPVVIKVVFKYRPDDEGLLFIKRARKIVEAAGFRLHAEVFPHLGCE